MAILGGETKDIDSKANALLRSVFGDIDKIKLPVDLHEILEYCGLSLKEGDFEDANLAGALDRKSRTIYVAADDPPWRQSFTIAHELGHLKLHDDVLTDRFYRQQVRQLIDSDVDERETQANQFAASLLMPERSVKELWKTFKDVDTLSRIFGVSKRAMRYRLKNLKLT